MDHSLVFFIQNQPQDTTIPEQHDQPCQDRILFARKIPPKIMDVIA